ncbi:MAG: Vgb family protein [Acidimicrobiales bacterium]
MAAERKGAAPPRPTGRQRRAEARSAADERRSMAPGRRQVPKVPPLVVVVVAAFLIVGVTAGILATGGGGTAPQNTASPVGTAHTVLSGVTADLAFAAGSGWELDDVDGTLQRFDPADGRRVGAPVDVGGHPGAVVAQGNDLWLADSVANTVDEVDAVTGTVVGEPIPVAQDPVGIAAGDGAIWVASLIGNAVTEVDPNTHAVAATLALPDGAVRVAAGDGAVFVTGSTDTLAKVTIGASGALSATTTVVGRIPIGLAVTPGAVWVANSADGTVSEVDPTTMSVIETVPVLSGDNIGPPTNGTPGTTTTTSASGATGASSNPTQVAVFDGRVWVTDGDSNRIVAFDARSAEQLGLSVHLPGTPRALHAFGGALWIATANSGAAIRLTPR